MTATYKNLGQNAPTAATLTTLYTVPSATSAIVTALIVSNTSTTVLDTFKISVQVAAAADNIKQYIYGGNTASTGLGIPPLDTFVASIGLTLAATDVVKCYSTNGTCSFQLYGSEIT